jgi:short-subunit dehydrogenase
MAAQVAGIGNRIVLTGASGGIGAAIARRLAPRSESLILAGRQRASLDALAAQLKGYPVQLVCGDLCEASTLAGIVSRAQACGGIDILINNAGVSDFHAFETQAPATIRTLIETNLLAPMLLTRELLPLLHQAHAAQILNIGSVFGALGFPGFAAYGAGKAGLAGFSQALRRELSDTAIAVRYFSPRATHTSMNSSAVDALNRELGTAEDMPETVADAFMDFLEGSAWQRTLGTRESLFILLNKLLPRLPDYAIRKQLSRIRKHLPR